MEPSTQEVETFAAFRTASLKEADELLAANRMRLLEERVARLDLLLDERVAYAPVNHTNMATNTPLPETNIVRLVPYNLTQTDEDNVVLKSSTNRSLKTLRAEQLKRGKDTPGPDMMTDQWSRRTEFIDVDNYARSDMILSGSENKINFRFSDKSKAFCVGV